MTRANRICILIFALMASITQLKPAEAGNTMDILPNTEDLITTTNTNFSHFYFEGAEEDAQWLSRFLWYHFAQRLSNNPAPYPKEYLTLSDMWMNDAYHPNADKDPHWKGSMQEIMRRNLLTIDFDPDGFADTNQVTSHAHDTGWPFPIWIQGGEPNPETGHTVGWHFNEEGFGFIWDHMVPAWREQKVENMLRFFDEKATEGWELTGVKSEGIVNNRWKLVSTGEVSPTITTPEGLFRIDPLNSPFMQLRWKRSTPPPQDRFPYIEWMREGDTDFSPERRVYFPFDTGYGVAEHASGTTHSLIQLYTHPDWDRPVKRVRISLAPGESNVDFEIDSFFTVYDTRHTINDPIYILACWNYFRWTGDLPFLRKVVNNMRLGLMYQQKELGGLEHNFIRNPHVGHDGLAGFRNNPDGTKEILFGHGKGSNYWDILPIGADDMYATSQYYASTLVIAEMEEMIQANPGWPVPLGAMAFDPATLREHAAEVKRVANEKFWNPETGRFVACIDRTGVAHDYGFTFVNLDAIWYGIASDEHAREIMSWLVGERIVEGDTSQGEDIYRWRFGPRASTVRNLDWYPFVWPYPETTPFGYQVQDGGAVLGFSFYDLWARLKVLGPDNAWERLGEIMDWEREVAAAGGYRAYYGETDRGTTLQGGGTAGGIGIDFEFYESSLLPSIVPYGFMGLDPAGDRLRIDPDLPSSCPRMGIRDLRYHDVPMHVAVSADRIEVQLLETPILDVFVEPAGEGWQCDNATATPKGFRLGTPGVYVFEKK